jgi:hypothetical protein
VARAFDCQRHLTLMFGAISAYAPRNYLPAFRYKSPKPRYILIIYKFNLIYAKRTRTPSCSAHPVFAVIFLVGFHSFTTFVVLGEKRPCLVRYVLKGKVVIGVNCHKSFVVRFFVITTVGGLTLARVFGPLIAAKVNLVGDNIGSIPFFALIIVPSARLDAAHDVNHSSFCEIFADKFPRLPPRDTVDEIRLPFLALTHKSAVYRNGKTANGYAVRS